MINQLCKNTRRSILLSIASYISKMSDKIHQFKHYYDISNISFETYRFQKNLETYYVGRSFIYRKETESTMDIAQREISEGAATGTLILAEHQTKGRGRKGRTWLSERADNLYFSIIFRVNPTEPLHLLKLNFAVAIAVAQACRDEGVMETYIKWPNDIWVYSHQQYYKVCGMLIDSIQTANSELAAICGIGLNVNQDMTHLQEAMVGNQPISLKNVLSIEVDREKVLAKICNMLENLLGESLESVLHLYKTFDILVGKQVIITCSNGETKTGKAVGYSKYGSLMVEWENGTVTELMSEEVSIRPT